MSANSHSKPTLSYLSGKLGKVPLMQDPRLRALLSGINHNANCA